MAQIIGRSGAWLTIQRRLNSLNIIINKPQELASVLEHNKLFHNQWMEIKRQEFTQYIRVHEQRISELLTEKRILKRILIWFKIYRERKYIREWKWQEKIYEEFLLKRIQEIESTLNSSEPAGAIAELEVIDHLSKLSNDFFVLNDITLRATRFIRHKGTPLQSAQVDHIVVGPPGVFLIETKCWSKEFVEKGKFHDPFNQVGRASLFLHILLKTFSSKSKVRSIIATNGYLPKDSDQGYVTVRRISALSGYVKWFQQELSMQEIHQIVRFLNQSVSEPAPPQYLNYILNRDPFK